MMPIYAWQNLPGSPSKVYNSLNTRRNELLKKLAAESKEEDHEEWFALLEERDKLVKQMVERENEKVLLSHLSGLHRTLKVIGKFEHSSTPTTLKAALCHVHKELSAYLKDKPDLVEEKNERIIDTDNTTTCSPPRRKRKSTNSIEENNREEIQQTQGAPEKWTNTRKQTTCWRKKSPRATGNKTINVVKPRCPKSDRDIANMKSFPTINLQNSSFNRPPVPISCTTPSVELSSATPQPLHDDLRLGLLKGKENLKNTPGVKSPGGTPMKKERCLDLTDATDLVTHALRQKFINVRKLYGSPLLNDGDRSLNDSKEEEFLSSVGSVD